MQRSHFNLSSVMMITVVVLEEASPLFVAHDPPALDCSTVVVLDVLCYTYSYISLSLSAYLLHSHHPRSLGTGSASHSMDGVY